MKNLAGVKDADEVILEELYLAGIPAVKVDKSDGEVPYSFVGKIGHWIFKRRWYYYSATVENRENGLLLDTALELHNKKHPIKDTNLGTIIRSGGHCGCPPPDEYGAQPIYNEELNKQLEGLGYKRESFKLGDKEIEHIPISVGEVSKLCKEGKLKTHLYIDCYHINEQIGLNELRNAILNHYEKNSVVTNKL